MLFEISAFIRTDGSIGFLFDNKRNSFIEVNLTTGQHKVLVTELSKKVELCSIHDLIVVTRLSKMFILASIIRKETDKFCVSSFSFNSDEKKLSFVDIQDTACENLFVFFRNDENGRIFAMQYLSNWYSTFCYAWHIEIDCHGKIKLNILLTKRSFQGQWCAPFIQNGYLYFLPRPTEGAIKLLKVSLINERSVEVEVATRLDPETIFWVTQLRFNFGIRPQVTGGNIFCYTLNVSPIWRMEFFLHFDWKKQSWNKFSIDIRDHQLSNNQPELALDANGFLYLHGNCCLESCIEKAHIYVIAPTSYQSLSISNEAFIFQDLNLTESDILNKHQEENKKDQSQKSSLNEIKRLQDLSHPRIIEYYGFKFEDDSFVIFMEYMPLGSIRAIMKKCGPVEEKTTIKYISQILDGLEYLHNKGVVHNDLKCDNLLSDQNGNIKISDFGLAVQKLLNAENESYTNAKSEILAGGTVFWTAPEFFECESISRKSDIWSLGCTIVEMMTTRPPYSNLKYQNRLIIARAKNLLSYDPVELVPVATESMKKFIGCLLQINTAYRPADATEAAKIFSTLFS